MSVTNTVLLVAANQKRADFEETVQYIVDSMFPVTSEAFRAHVYASIVEFVQPDTLLGEIERIVRHAVEYPR